MLCEPGDIHGTLMRKASTISTDLWRCGTTLFASVLAWLERRLDRAPADGQKRAEAAMMEVQRKEERERV